MNALTILKRSTAVAALTTMAVALPSMAPGQNQQMLSGQAPPEQLAQATGETGPANESGMVTEGKQGTQSGDAPDQATSDERAPANETGVVTEGKQGTQSGDAPDQAAGDERAPANETGIVTEGKQGTQSGDAPDQATSDERAPANETGVVTEGKQGTQSGDAPDQAASDEPAPAGAAKMGDGQDMVVAKVGDREIRQSDVLTAIGKLPPELHQQRPEMLIPIAIDQLVMRELILQEAKEAGLESDPGVSSLPSGTSPDARDDAMVRAWLDKELGQAVTDEKVNETYDAVKQQMGDDVPPMEALRPQIERELRQQAFLDLSEELQADAEITVYGPDGQAITK